MILRFAMVLLAAGAGVDLPRIGCWRESPSAGPARVLFGVAGNLVVRPAGEEGCENEAEWSGPDDGGVRTLRIDRRWQLALTAEGERYLLYRGSQRHELPQ
jgi:hypothetical protein